MKILWISAREFSSENEKQSGVWLKSLALMLSKHKEIQLGNVTKGKSNTEVQEAHLENIRQWVIPSEKINKKGYPRRKTKQELSNIIDQFNPDIIQIWGSENPFKLLAFDKDFKGIKVLTMQGVLASIGSVLLSDLSMKELISTIGIREIYFRKNLFKERRSFYHEAKLEKQMIENCNHIIVQSEWTKSQIQYINPEASIYFTNRALRNEFLQSNKWNEFEHKKAIIYNSSVGYTLKGLHTFIRSIVLVKKLFSEIEVRIAGSLGRTDILGDGYLKFIRRLIRKNDLEKNIIWLGSLTGDQIVNQLQEASVFVQPSYVESYSMVLAEAMAVGTPSVVSFAGAMPELADNEKEALFFSPGDYKRCAFQIIKALSSKELSSKLSQNALNRSKERNIDTDIVEQQLDIYKSILNKV